ncbi:MAG: prepilin-type N-terminal cleavage/methylation domain-containing protein [bacterium]
MTIKNNEKYNQGFSLIEVILATAIFVMIVSALAGALVYGIQLAFQSGTSSQAAYIAQEGIEIFRNYRDLDYSNLVDGSFGIDISNNEYQIVSGSDTDGKYIRTITVTTLDQDTKQIVSEVTWDQGTRGSGSVKLFSYLTNWMTISGKQGMLVYSDNTVIGDGIKYRVLYDDFSWGPELNIPTYGVPGNTLVRSLKLYSSPTKDEKILVVKNAQTPGTAQTITAMVWRGSSWSRVTQLSNYSNTDPSWLKNFDGTYLKNGNFVVVYSDGTNIPKYRTWNGSTWSSQSSISDISARPFWIVTRNKPGTNEFMLAIQNSSQKNQTSFYNGSLFSTFTTHGTLTPTMYGENIDFVWNTENTNEGFLLYNDESDNTPNIRKWNGSWQTTVENIDIGAVPTHNDIIQQPESNTFLSCFKDNARDINCLRSDNSPIFETTVNGEIAQWTHDNVEKSFDMAFEASGTNALVVYANGTGVAQRRISKYRYYNPSTNTWSTEFDGITLGPTEASAMETVRLIPNTENDYIMVIMAASDQDIWTNVWDGENNTYFSTGSMGPIEQGLFGSVDEDYWYDFSWD